MESFVSEFHIGPRRVFIPISVDVNLLLSTCPPQIRNFTNEKLLIVLSIISEVSVYNDEDILSNGFRSIYSKKLQSGVHDYKEYINYLIANKIIEVDYQYIVGEKCRGYKFSERYNTEFEEVALALKPYRRRRHIKNLPLSEIRSLSDHAYVTKWINDISIDFVGAELYLDKLKSSTSGDLHILKSYNSGKISISKIQHKEFYYQIDNTSNRLHTNLTNLGSSLRRYLRYQGKTLVSHDIRNSQLYFVTVLLSPTFYQANSKFSIYKLKLKSIKQVEINLIVKDAIIMLESLNNVPTILDIKLFTELVSTGKLYDYLLDRANELSIKGLSDRNRVKKAVFLLIFSDDKNWRSRPGSFKRLFVELFPNVCELFKIIKKGNHNSLAILLQRIESYLVIDVICKEISRINEDIPLFTIHDSIATTEEFSELVHKIMKEKLTSFVGVSPTLKKEYWQ